MVRYNMGYIYKVTNKVNGKVYIGQTKYTVEWRWKTHLYATFRNTAADHNSMLHKAIRKYGIDAFDVCAIEECNAKDLNPREAYWIKQYDATNHDKGYNILSGGDHSVKYTDEEIYQYWNAGYGVSEIAKLIPKPIGRHTVRARLVGMGVSEEEIVKRGKETIRHMKHKIVYQYSLDGEYLKAFYSATEAGDETNCCVSNITQAAAGQIKSAGGFLWSYEKKERLPSHTRRTGYTLVGKYDADGKLVEAYTSLTSAGKHNDISHKKLSMVCEHEEEYQGFTWRFIKIEDGVIHVYD